MTRSDAIRMVEDRDYDMFKDWHPKCETCGKYRRADAHLQGFCMVLDIDLDDEKANTFGCLEHTALRGEEE